MMIHKGGAIQAAGRIAAALGAAVLCEALPPRVDRGAGLPDVRRLPYFPQASVHAQETLHHNPLWPNQAYTSHWQSPCLLHC